ncbi:ATP-binding cassette domain-containing protein [Croceibacterium ferulae]|uniref:ATP-binding cassette domain-containing protein n=1 Tax=Croceibacterium ferulae TaxID=1854641 RepID=UPI000EAECE27|nr:ATP-binding cassette domain-containing protein [Croceibacterium ferulae]
MRFDVTLRHPFGALSSGIRLHSDAALCAITGPSGTGKTTIAHCIAGLRRPAAGRIVVDGAVLFDSDAGIDLPAHRRRAGYVFQDARLFPHLSVAGNLAYGERLARAGDGWIGRAEVVELLGIGHLLDRRPATLSGGEVRRVAIGRALLSAPRFLLLDEPTASLDGARVTALLALIERIRDTLPVPILLISHAAAEVERLAGHVLDLAPALDSRAPFA